MTERPAFADGSVRCVYLVDIAGFLHRSMYVVHRDNLDQVPATDTASAYHALAMLAGIVETLGASEWAACYDSTDPSLRCDEFAAYKAGRRAHPPVFTENYKRFLLGLSREDTLVLGESRYEADDVIGTLVERRAGTPLVIVSSDKDLWQYMGPEVAVFDPKERAWRSAADCRAKFGVEPSQLCDFIGLVGDTSDGIPGVAGIGAKTAEHILREFGDIDAVYDPDRLLALSETVSTKQVERLMVGKDQAFLSRSMARYRQWPGCPHLDAMDFKGATGAALRRAKL